MFGGYYNWVACCLIHGGDPFQKCMFNDYYIFKIEVVRL